MPMFGFACSGLTHVLLPLAHEAMGAAQAPGIPCALVSKNFGRMCERAVGSEPPVAGTEPAAPKGDRACKRARDSSGVFLNPNSCKGFEPERARKGVDDGTK